MSGSTPVGRFAVYQLSARRRSAVIVARTWCEAVEVAAVVLGTGPRPFSFWADFRGSRVDRGTEPGGVVEKAYAVADRLNREWGDRT